MSIINSVLKLFIGDKSKQDVKSILPIVDKIKINKTDTYKHHNKQTNKNENISIL